MQSFGTFLNDYSNKNVPNDYIAIDGHVYPDKTDQNKPVPFWQV